MNKIINLQKYKTMKKLFYLILTSFLLFTCNPHKSKIINDWNLISITTYEESKSNENSMSKSRTTLDMKKDGSFTFTSDGNDEIINKYFPFYNRNGFWELEGDVLSLQFTDGSDGGITLDFLIIEERSIDRFRIQGLKYRISTAGVSANDIIEILSSEIYFVSYSFEQAF